MEYFTCIKCGQVFHETAPINCLRCNATNFKPIEKKDIINIHDILEEIILPYIFKIFGES